MSLILVNSGEQAFLQNGITGVAYTLRLYKTDVIAGLTPSEIDDLVSADFTEATFTGYSSQAIGTGDWTVTQGNPTEAVNVEKAFVSSANQSAQNVWGYYVTRTSDGVLMWFEQFDGPMVVEFLNDEIDVTPAMTLDDSGGNQVDTGVILEFGGPTPPTGYLLCDGSAVSRSTYSTLFAVIGTAYGVGDGSTTFNLPDRRGRLGLGKADAGTGATLGETGGAIDHVHGLDTASSHAKMRFGANRGDHRRKTTAEWTETVRIDDLTTATSASSFTDGIELGGDSDTANPPFQVFNYIIRT